MLRVDFDILAFLISSPALLALAPDLWPWEAHHLNSFCKGVSSCTLGCDNCTISSSCILLLLLLILESFLDNGVVAKELADCGRQLDSAAGVLFVLGGQEFDDLALLVKFLLKYRHLFI